MRGEKNVWVVNNIWRRVCKVSAETKGAKLVLMLDEENLYGFFWMGFHDISCLFVSLIFMFVSNACILWMSRFEYITLPLLWIKIYILVAHIIG